MPHFLLKATTTFLLLSFFLSPPLTTAEDVFSIRGSPLTDYLEYQVVPFLMESGGGLEYLKTRDPFSKCPNFAVAQSPNHRCGVDYGFPMTFKRVDKVDAGGNIQVSDDVTITFSGDLPPIPYYCNRRRLLWEMVKHGGTSNQWTVELAELQEDYDDDDISSNSVFKIEKNEAYGYRLMHCPENNDFNISNLGVKQQECWNLAPVYDRRLGIHRLSAVDDDTPPFQIMFMEADRGGRSPY